MRETALSLQDAARVHATVATTMLPWSLWKNRALTPNARPSLAGCLLTGRRKDDPHDLHCRQRRRLDTDRREDGRYLRIIPKRLAARAKRYGLTSRCYGPKTSTVLRLACFNAASLRACFRRSR